ncbi:MAG: hypothetical protein OXE94_09375 [Aestuariivita sp.]|nr:hypothetical protein [Aestuariivita sp.]MCY4203469.1 hypothetical protein [Aestuariivita sp.]MCY4288513.1 hypothetical protein [Aestuariivita sp.]MCY4347096.1 hypothetical protein [Aestuariivita sp.]
MIRVDPAAARRHETFTGRETRVTLTEVLWQRRQLPMPNQESSRLGKDAVPLTAAHVIESNPPLVVEPLRCLLTTLSITTRSNAMTVLDYYALSWHIEDWHRILKSVCEVEKIAHNSTERIKRATTINALSSLGASRSSRCWGVSPPNSRCYRYLRSQRWQSCLIMRVI